MLDPQFVHVQELDQVDNLAGEHQVPVAFGPDSLGKATLEQLAAFVLAGLPVLRDGIDGRTVLHGDGAPVAELGAEGDFYISSELTLYGPKVEGAWGAGVPMRGLSAYEIAVAHGYVGTEADWLAMISNGSSGYADAAQQSALDAANARDASIAARDLSIGASNTATAARDDAIEARDAAIAAASAPTTIADVDGLTDALAGKADDADVTALQGELDGKVSGTKDGPNVIIAATFVSINDPVGGGFGFGVDDTTSGVGYCTFSDPSTNTWGYFGGLSAFGRFNFGGSNAWEFEQTPYVGAVRVSLEGHVHTIAEVTGLQAELDGKVDALLLDAALDLKLDADQVGAANGVASLDAGGKVPASQLPEVSTAIADVDGLTDALAGKVDQAALDAVQLDLDGKIDATEKGAANGVASLDATGKVPAAQLPASSGGSGPTTIADVDGLQDALDAKADADDLGLLATDVAGKASQASVDAINAALPGKADDADIVALQNQIDGKAPTVHSHGLADVTGLNAALAAKVDSSSKGAANGVASLDASGLVPAAQLAGLNGSFDAKVDKTSIGAANGVAGLDATGKVPAAQLPSFVDDVLEVANFAALPGAGESGKIYVTIDNGKTWRWGGSAYAEISAAPGSTDAVPEGAGNLYFTAARVLGTLATGLVGTAGTPAATDSLLTILGKILKGFFTDHSGQGGAVHANAVSGGAAGFMTGADKAKLDAITGTHTGNNTGDQTAATVPFTPAGNIAATNVQAALAELDSEKVATSAIGTAAAKNLSVGTVAPASPSLNDLWVDTN